MDVFSYCRSTGIVGVRELAHQATIHGHTVQNHIMLKGMQGRRYVRYVMYGTPSSVRYLLVWYHTIPVTIQVHMYLCCMYGTIWYCIVV